MSDEVIVSNQDWKKKKPLMVRLYDRRDLTPGKAFQTATGAQYGVIECGAFVRLNKDRRSKKERNRARRALKNG